jgi:Stealth protein CR2, conserved region 2/Stealth protein CR3, conserved region 3/Stealth protein CR1, conserved region 1/Stealth protein CR4, conserved region 4/CDP-Glycerol:Poly(glycerophosphate) glycerophosphotransferase
MIKGKRMKTGFILTTPYQVFHYKRIAKHLSGQIEIIMEMRDQELGLDKRKIAEDFPGMHIRKIHQRDLIRLDGTYDVLVCQTPVPVMQFFTRSLVVAQQYSLAKEVYQYGIWRVHAHLNLMYGSYSVNKVKYFSNAVAAGNPLLDDVLSNNSLIAAPDKAEISKKPHVMYMPTYGDLSDKEAILSKLSKENVEVTVKAHHADTTIKHLSDQFGFHVLTSSEDPIQAICSADVVISDVSGAVFDALAVRKPVVVVYEISAESQDLSRLSEADENRKNIEQLISYWNQDKPLKASIEAACDALQDDTEYRQYLDTFYINPGEAGKSCAHEIEELYKHGENYRFEIQQLRNTTKNYISENRQFKAARNKLTSGMKPLHKRLIINSINIVRASLQYIPYGRKIESWLISLYRSQKQSPATKKAAALHSSLSLVPRIRRKEIQAELEPMLIEEGVDYRFSEMQTNLYCAVKEEELDKLLHVLHKLPFVKILQHAGLKLCTAIKREYTKNPESITFKDLSSAISICIYVPFRTGLYTTNTESGIEVLILEKKDRRLVARKWLAGIVDWTNYYMDATEKTINGNLSKHTISKLHKLENEPIDIVYTWVDSNDPRWRASYNEWVSKQEKILTSATNEERYIDRNELKFSLRSIHMYAPFVRNVFIVTAGHVPEWLNLDVPNLKVVKHEDIFPDASYLPTFNSHSIEACLQNIPSLSENFIYFNDDVFLGQEVGIDMFYTKAGLIKSRFSPSAFTASSKPGEDAIPTDWASYNAVSLIKNDFNLFFDRKMKHVAMPLKKSVLEDIEKKYAVEVDNTRKSRFRDTHDLSIPSMLAHFYAISTRRGVEWANIPNEYMYLDTGRFDFNSKINLLRRKKVAFICLNSTGYTDIPLNRQASMLDSFLNSQYPVPSPYEK